MAASPDRLVSLTGGFIVPVEALRLVWLLEDDGFTFRVGEDGALFVAPFERLSAEQLDHLRRWKRHVLVLVRYCDHGIAEGHPNGSAAVRPARYGNA